MRRLFAALLAALLLAAPVSAGGAAVSVTTPGPYTYGQTITVAYSKFSGGGFVAVKCFQGDVVVYRKTYPTFASITSGSRAFTLNDATGGQPFLDGNTTVDPNWDGQAATCVAYIATGATTGQGFKERIVAEAPAFTVNP